MRDDRGCSTEICDGRFHRSVVNDRQSLALCRSHYPHLRPYHAEGLRYGSTQYLEEMAKLPVCARCHECQVERSTWSICYACGLAIEMQQATDPGEIRLLALEVLRLALPSWDEIALPKP